MDVNALAPRERRERKISYVRGGGGRIKLSDSIEDNTTERK